MPEPTTLADKLKKQKAELEAARLAKKKKPKSRSPSPKTKPPKKPAPKKKPAKKPRHTSEPSDSSTLVSARHKGKPRAPQGEGEVNPDFTAAYRKAKQTIPSLEANHNSIVNKLFKARERFQEIKSTLLQTSLHWRVKISIDSKETSPPLL